MATWKPPTRGSIGLLSQETRSQISVPTQGRSTRHDQTYPLHTAPADDAGVGDIHHSRVPPFGLRAGTRCRSRYRGRHARRAIPGQRRARRSRNRHTRQRFRGRVHRATVFWPRSDAGIRLSRCSPLRSHRWSRAVRPAFRSIARREIGGRCARGAARGPPDAERCGRGSRDRPGAP